MAYTVKAKAARNNSIKTQTINPVYPYTVNEVAQILRVHPETVRLWYEQGKIRCLKLGHRTVRVLGEDIIEFMQTYRNNSDNVSVQE